MADRTPAATGPRRDRPPEPVPGPPRRRGGRPVDAALWALLAVTASGNVMTSPRAGNLLVALALGAVAAGCVVALTLRYLRPRR